MDDEKKLIGMAYIRRFPRQTGCDEGNKYDEETRQRKNGNDWLQNVLSCGNPNRISEDLGVALRTFEDLKEKLEPEISGPKTKPAEVNEIIATFLMVLITGCGFRGAKSKLGRSKSTISAHFWKCAKAFFEKVYGDEIDDLLVERGGHRYVRENEKFQPFGAIRGAGDGCLIATHCLEIDAARMRSRKGYTARNVLQSLILIYFICFVILEERVVQMTPKFSTN